MFLKTTQSKYPNAQAHAIQINENLINNKIPQKAKMYSQEV